MGYAPQRWLSIRHVIALCLCAVLCFHLAYTIESCAFLATVSLFCFFTLTRIGSTRLTFYLGLVVGLAIYAPQLSFFWGIFGAAAILLWLVPSVWLALFMLIGRLCRCVCRPVTAAVLLPLFWTGLEYFRSELYYLRFSWLNAGYAFSQTWLLPFAAKLGMYGIGLAIMLVGAGVSLLPRRAGIAIGLVLLAGLGIVSNLPVRVSPSGDPPPGLLCIAAVQLEFPSQSEVIAALDRLIEQCPHAQLLMLSEYTFSRPVPQRVRDWCKEHQRYLVAGGKDPAPKERFYNTVFVVGPDGQVVFRQVKSAPIQFFKDGLPAAAQSLWDSPWGKIGLCVCYDLSYTRVTDELVRQGASAILVPTMDVMGWGGREHELHALVAPMRAAEYGVPIVRVCSSGISQVVDRRGRVLVSAPYPGQGQTIAGSIDLRGHAALPIDRIAAPAAVVVTIGFVLAMPILWRRAARTAP